MEWKPTYKSSKRKGLNPRLLSIGDKFSLLLVPM
jgi:hypothetical protein